MAEPTSSPRLSLTMKLVVVGVLYFAEGIPFGFIITSVNAYLSGRGVAPEQIGILSLLSLPWSLKFFWSPLVDRYGTRATWIVAAQAVMILCLLGLASLVGGPVTLGFWVLLGILPGFGHPGPGDRRLHHRFPGDPGTGDGQWH